MVFLVYLLVAKVYVLVLRVGVELSEAIPPLVLPLQCQQFAALIHHQIACDLGVLWPARSCERVHVVIALESADSPLGSYWKAHVWVGF